MKTYTLNVFNTTTGRYEDVAVTEEVYHTYRRSGWKIENTDTSFFAHEIQFSGLKGGDESAYENFHEFICYESDPSDIVGVRLERQALCAAVARLDEWEQDLIKALFVENKSMRKYAAEADIPLMTVQNRKARILCKLHKLVESQK